METVILNRASRVLAGHLWIFSNEIQGSPKRYLPGSLVEVKDKAGAFLGKGYANPASLIAVRILTREKEAIDEGFFKKRVSDALDFRTRFTEDCAFRAVFSESDLLPGLIVDKFGDCLSVQFHTLGMEALGDTVLKVLDDVFAPRTIVLKNDAHIRALEGLPLEKKIIKGDLERLPIVKINGALYEIDPMAGQKTGFFLDQKENRAAFASLLKGKEKGLDLFCYTGAWAIEAAMRGCRVIGVDSSEKAVGQANRNAGLNHVAGLCEFKKADVFDFMKSELGGVTRHDFITLDPPAFVKNKTGLKQGLRAYRDINASAMRLLKRGGLLSTSSCSFHVDRGAFLEALRSSERDSKRRCRVIDVRTQSKDHPISLSVPETEYLKCVFLEVS